MCKKCAEKMKDHSDRKRSLDAGALPLVNLSLTTNMTESYRAMTSKGTWVSSRLEGKESMRVRTFPSTTVGSSRSNTSISWPIRMGGFGSMFFFPFQRQRALKLLPPRMRSSNMFD